MIRLGIAQTNNCYDFDENLKSICGAIEVHVDQTLAAEEEIAIPCLSTNKPSCTGYFNGVRSIDDPVGEVRTETALGSKPKRVRPQSAPTKN